MPRAKGLRQIVDRLHAPEPRGAGKDINVDRAGFRPGVQDRVRLAQDQHAGEPGLRKRV